MAHSILVVDDDPHIRDVVRFAFEKSGMAISIAQDGKERWPSSTATSTN
jgi:two-component system OmpR family response regulator